MIEVVKAIFDEIRAVQEDMEYRIDSKADLARIHPRSSFAYRQEALDLMSSKRRLGALREAFLGKLMHSVQDNVKLEELKSYLDQRLSYDMQSEKHAVDSSRRMATCSEKAVGKAFEDSELFKRADELLDRCKKGEFPKEVLEEVLKRLVGDELYSV